jgi:hypothetical protein
MAMLSRKASEKKAMGRGNLSHIRDPDTWTPVLGFPRDTPGKAEELSSLHMTLSSPHFPPKRLFQKNQIQIIQLNIKKKFSNTSNFTFLKGIVIVKFFCYNKFNCTMY